MSPIAASSIDLISIRLLPYSDLVSSASTSKVILIITLLIECFNLCGALTRGPDRNGGESRQGISGIAPAREESVPLTVIAWP